VKEKGKITNSDYQTLNDVSRETATRDLKELIDKKLIKPSGQKGAGHFIHLIELRHNCVNCVINKTTNNGTIAH
jgi:predicted HTH transcriptional regulator